MVWINFKLNGVSVTSFKNLPTSCTQRSDLQGERPICSSSPAALHHLHLSPRPREASGARARPCSRSHTCSRASGRGYCPEHQGQGLPTLPTLLGFLTALPTPAPGSQMGAMHFLSCCNIRERNWFEDIINLSEEKLLSFIFILVQINDN